MSVLVHYYSEFRCGFWREKQAGNSFLGRKLTHHGWYHFNVVLEHEMVAIGEEHQWKGEAELCFVFIRNGPNFKCSIFFSFVNEIGINSLRGCLVCEPWDSSQLEVWFKDYSIVRWGLVNMA